MKNPQDSMRDFAGAIINNIGKKTVSEEDHKKIRDSFTAMFSGFGSEMERIHEDITRKREEFDKEWKKSSPFSDDDK